MDGVGGGVTGSHVWKPAARLDDPALGLAAPGLDLRELPAVHLEGPRTPGQQASRGGLWAQISGLALAGSTFLG